MKSLPSLGRVSEPDRVQRLILGGALMVLTVWGLTERMDWRSLVALGIQFELLLTGLAGWCPMYCSYRAIKRKQPFQEKHHEDGPFRDPQSRKT